MFTLLIANKLWVKAHNVGEYYVILLVMNIMGKALLSFSIFQRWFYFSDIIKIKINVIKKYYIIFVNEM